MSPLPVAGLATGKAPATGASTGIGASAATGKVGTVSREISFSGLGTFSFTPVNSARSPHPKASPMSAALVRSPALASCAALWVTSRGVAPAVRTASAVALSVTLTTVLLVALS